MYKFKFEKIRFYFFKSLCLIIFIYICFNYSSSFIIDVFKKNYEKFFSTPYIHPQFLNLGLIVISFILIYSCNNAINMSLKNIMGYLTYKFLGTNDFFATCCLNLKDKYLIIFNDNIETKIYYNEIKKIYNFKTFIIITYSGVKKFNITLHPYICIPLKDFNKKEFLDTLTKKICENKNT